ncbi:MAG: OmpA family protein [bacterium]|nr:OmpA family protein [bacterium]
MSRENLLISIPGINMKKFFNYLAILFAAVVCFPAILQGAVTLKWDIPGNARLEAVRTAKVKYYTNSKLVRIYKERNIIDLTCDRKEKSGSHVRGVFSVFRKELKDTVFNLKEQTHADFLIKPTGRYLLAAKAEIPNLRHIPTLPGKAVASGHTWTAPAEMVLRSFSIPFQLTFKVKYRLVGIEKREGRTLAAVSYAYRVNKDMSKGKYPADFPVKIMGQRTGTIYWDVKENYPIVQDDDYRIIFLFKDGRRMGTIEFNMKMDTRYRVYTVVTKNEQEKAKEEMKKELPKESGIDVDTDKRGLVLRMGEVLFDFDSHKLRPHTKKALNKVIKAIKKKYPDREIIVEGHTDDTGKAAYNQKLSKKRARSVAEYLKPGIGHDKNSYRGFGSKKPIANNRSKEGRKKNRRVEIIIKLN